MNIIELIQQKYGNTCRLRSPLKKNQCEKAKNIYRENCLTFSKSVTALTK